MNITRAEILDGLIPVRDVVEMYLSVVQLGPRTHPVSIPFFYLRHGYTLHTVWTGVNPIGDRKYN